MIRWIGFLLTLHLFVLPGGVHAAQVVQKLSIEGDEGKKEEIEELLPRPLPTELTDAEIVEFTRRIKNLALFDLVEVLRTRSFSSASANTSDLGRPVRARPMPAAGRRRGFC